jgi:hemoglobin
VVAHAFDGALQPDHVERLAAYWAEALGGPVSYTGVYGDETAVVRMHAGHGEHAEMDERAIRCFDQALSDVGVMGELATALHDYFAWSTRSYLPQWSASASEVPSGLAVRRWTWDGLSPEAP